MSKSKHTRDYRGYDDGDYVINRAEVDKHRKEKRIKSALHKRDISALLKEEDEDEEDYY
jgi:hypothetical protein